MKIILYMLLALIFFSLQACGTMTVDCSTLSSDRNSYRNCMAKQGDPNSQYELGVAAFEDQDYMRAISWLKRASKPRRESAVPLYADTVGYQKYQTLSLKREQPMMSGHRGALRMLVTIYEQGLGVNVDLEEAEKYRQMINEL